MELNKNKIVFLWIAAMILLSIIFLLLTAKNTKNDDSWTVDTSDSFKIWLVWDTSLNYTDFINGFKQIHSQYKDRNIVVETFPTYEDYTYTLTSALSSWVWPDIFVLNNNENKSVFSEQISWIDPSVVNPNDFRKKYKWIFWDDLIITDSNNEEFLSWIPVWYETLGVFYNRRYVRDSDLQTLSSLNNVVSNLAEKYSWVTPIWIWNGTTVQDSADIVTQFFMLEDWVESVSDLTWNVLKQWLGSYLLYWDVDWFNKFNNKYVELRNLWEDSLYSFSRWEIFMIVGYPSMLSEIKENWFSKTLLSATAFPHYYSWAWKTLLNYNYFVINKDTSNFALSQDLLSYLTTDSWASSYLDVTPYYLPSLLSLEADKFDSKIDPDYNIILNDFYNEDYELSSFDKWIKNVYDNNLVPLLDNWSNYENNFEKFRSSIICKTNKVINFTNLSKNCE